MNERAGMLTDPRWREEGYTRVEKPATYGTGSASTLSMDEEEKAAAAEREKTKQLGFVKR